MKKLFIASFLVILSGVANAMYIPPPLYVLIIKAESIVYGEIIEIDSVFFTFKIENSITGDTGIIKIEKFKNWPCAFRWKDYEIGQKLFLFLKKYNGNLRALGGGYEGELPIFQDSVYIHGLSLDPPPPIFIDGNDTIQAELHYNDSIYFEYKSNMVYGAEFRGLPVQLTEFISTVTDIRGCFNFEYGMYNRIINGSVTCSDDVLKNKINTNKFFRWTYTKLIE
jgi:hypothetical protein